MTPAQGSLEQRDTDTQPLPFIASAELQLNSGDLEGPTNRAHQSFRPLTWHAAFEEQEDQVWVYWEFACRASSKAFYSQV